MEFFEIFGGIFIVVWFFVFGFIIFTIIKNVKHNKNAPTLHVTAEIVDKEKKVSSSHHNDGMHHSHTYYYVVFKVRSGDTIKLNVGSDEYHSMYVGDKGILEFKGTKFIGFGTDDNE